MTGQPKDVDAVIKAMEGRTLPAAVNVVSIVLMALGLVAFLAGWFGMGDGGAVAWGSFLVGLLWTLAIAQGGVLFGVLMSGTWGRWGRSLKRIAESFGFFLPVAYLMLFIFVLFGMKIYPWNPNTVLEPVDLAPHSPEAVAAKVFWLRPWFFSGRLLLAMGIMLALDFVYLRAALRPDLILARSRLGNKAPGWWSSITGSHTDPKAVLKTDLRTQERLVPIIGAAYALIFSLLAFDLMMSLSPWWASNMFGAWTFVSAFWLSLAALGFTAMLAKDWLGISAFISPKATHDLGKLMLAGTMFWAYTGFAQLLPIWYTDMPEETNFLLIRLYLPEWAWLSRLVAVCCFLAPFTILLSRGIKKMRWPFLGLCTLIMVGMFLERTLIVLPSIYMGDPRDLMVMFVTIGTWLGFVGLFVQVVGRALAQLPPLVITDPRLEGHPWDVHVHSLDHAHH